MHRGGVSIGAVLRACLAAVLTLLAAPVLAQDAPTALLADRITFDPGKDALIATGNVEIIYDDLRLIAAKVTFFNRTGKLSAEGPIVLQQDGGARVLADFIELDEDVARGVVQGARMVLAANFQIAANEARLIDANRTGLYKTVASACQICAEAQTPLWLIRAERVVRDTSDMQIHFQNVRLEAFGVVVGYLPYLRMADPSVDRATGLLTPETTRSDFYGYGVKLPYYIVIDQSRDVTITPFLTSIGAFVLEGEYRQAFQLGRLSVTGAAALANGDVEEDGLRGFIGANGALGLDRDFALSFDVITTSDKGFMRQFAYSDADRLPSEVSVTRQRPNEYIAASAVGFQTLRDTESNATIPNALPEISYARIWDDAFWGGRVELNADTTTLIRRSGRDVAEFSLGSTWQKGFFLPGGIAGRAIFGADTQLYFVADDPAFEAGPTALASPLVGAELRWPFARSEGERLEVIEPIVQLVYSDRFGDDDAIPNEDSPTLEFDAANLFALDRFPGNDAKETGLRFNVGANYTRVDPAGWSLSTTFGQVYRTEMATGFPANTGLSGKSSNIVAAVNFDFPPVFELSNQSLFDQDFNFARNDVQSRLSLENFDISGSYVYLAADAATATAEQHEITLSSRYRFARNWAFDASWRRNLATGDNVSAVAGIEYGNECIRTRFSVSRRFTNSTSLPPGTDFGLTVRLAGFGGSQSDFPARACVRYEEGQ